MRIVIWNVERGYTPEKTAKILKETDADIYLLTEVDRGVRRTNHVDVFAYLKEELGLGGFFAREFKELDSPWRSIIRTGGPGGGEHGCVILAKERIESCRIVHLPTNQKLRWTGDTILPELFEPRIGSRIAQVCTVRHGSSLVQVVNTHLENWRSSWQHRKEQLNTIFDTIDPQLPTVIGGDFNGCEQIWKKLFNKKILLKEEVKLRDFLTEQAMFDPFEHGDSTFKGYGLSGKLDWLVLPSDANVLHTQNLETDYSDHHCLIADIDFNSH